MDTRPPKRKARAPRGTVQPLPVPVDGVTKCCQWQPFLGYLSGDRVFIEKSGHVSQLYNMGFFGKGTLSKHEPTFEQVCSRKDFNLRSHLQKATGKVYLKRTFSGSLAQGCKQPGELVSASSLAEQLSLAAVQFRERRIQPVSSNTTNLPVSGQSSAVEGCATSCSVEHAAPVPVSCIGDHQHVRTDDHAVTPEGSLISAAGKNIEDAWDEAEPDSDFWLADSHSPRGCETLGGSSALTPPCGGAAAAAAAPDSIVRSLVPESSPCITLLHCNEVARQTAQCMAAGGVPEFSDMPVPCNVDESSSRGTRKPAAQQLHATDLTEDYGDTKCAIGPSPAAGACAVYSDSRKVTVHEHLELLLEEAFFLAYGLGCLKVVSRDSAHTELQPGAKTADQTYDSTLDLETLWRMMCARQPLFLPRYVVYHYLRSKGWVPRDGVRYGADFVVYKLGPPYYHASYSVVVIPVDEGSLEASSTFPAGRPWTWRSISGINRVTQTVNKELLMCYVIIPAGLSKEQMTGSPSCLQHFSVHFVRVHRLVSSKERESESDIAGLP